MTADGGGGEAVASAAPALSEAARREFAALLDRRDIHVEFQPVVDLRTDDVVALEALARGPQGTDFESPRALFEAARAVGRVGELDWVCRVAAFAAFIESGQPPSLSLFVNTEPEGIAAACPPDLTAHLGKAESQLRVFVEVNDEAMASNPAGVLSAVDRAREMGWGIAIDDIGASRVPAAMLPIVQADVVKLDLRLLHEADAEEAAATLTSLLRHVEATGASLLIERIESQEDAVWARALGAVYGQGLHLGAPAPLGASRPVPRVPVPLVRAVSTDVDLRAPFDLVAEGSTRRMTGDLVDRLADFIVGNPRTAEAWPIVLVGAGEEGPLGRARVAELFPEPRGALLQVAFGENVAAEAAPGVRGVRLPPGDPLVGEPFLVVLTDQTSVALLARRVADGRFDVAVTQDQEVVDRIAHHLIRRVPSPGTDNLVLPGPLPSRAETPAPATAIAGNPRRTNDRRGWLGLR